LATVLYLRNTTNNGISDGSIASTIYDMVTAPGSSIDTAVTNTTASGTELQLTKIAAGSTIAWISGRAPAGGFTLTEADISLWQLESNMNANIAGRFRIYKRTAGGTVTQIGSTPWNDDVEMTTATREDSWGTVSLTDTAFAENDRIIIKVFLTNVGTMATGFTGTLSFNAAAGASGDSFFNIVETVAFKAEPTATFDQDSFRLRNDNGSETTATWLAATNTNAPMLVDTTYRARFLVQQTGELAATDVDFEWQYNLAGAGWNNITTSSSAVRAVASPNFVDGANCTQQLGAGAFFTANAGMTEDGTAGGTTLALPAGQEAETELSFQIRAVDVTPGQTVQLRLTRDGGVVLNTYTQTPTVTITFPPGAAWLAALNTSTTVDVTSGNAQLRLRVGVTNSGTSGATAYKWQYRKNAGTWTDLTASSANVKTFASGDFADGDDVPQLITGGAYQSDNNAAEESTGAFTLPAGLAGSTSVESEIALEVISADVANTDTLEFRIVQADNTPLDAYSQTPSMTISKTGAAVSLVQKSRRIRFDAFRRSRAQLR
jgi:hypothetical protein